jgi:hypothetical protein
MPINVSISESDDSENQGFPTWQVNRVTLQLVAALFGQGASAVFGHDWREDGVMEAVYGFARQMQAPIPLSPAEAAAENQPLLYNLLPWPNRPYLSESDLEQLSSTLRVDSAGLPEELLAFDDEAQRASPNSEPYRYLRARGLTFLRHRLTDVSHARLCLGGRCSGFAGRYPGVIEEALLSVRHDKPLYVAGFLGGGAAQVIDAIERREMPHDFCSSPLQDLYRNPPFPELNRSNSDHTINSPAVWNEFSKIGSERLATINGLKVEENNELFHTPVIDRVIELVLTGLSRLRHNIDSDYAS